VLNYRDGTVRRVDARGGDVRAAIPTMAIGNGGDIATGGGFVWVTSLRVPVIKIDPKTNTVTGSRPSWKIDGRCNSLRRRIPFGLWPINLQDPTTGVNSRRADHREWQARLLQ
jgi:hypothetical protein